MAVKTWSLETPADNALTDTVPGLIRDIKEHAFTSSGFYAEQQSTPDDTIAIYAGVCFFGTTKVEYAGLDVVDLGTGGAFEVSALTADYYNKILFTLDSSGTLKAYEGTENAVLASVVEPVNLSGEFPICMVSVQDDGTGTAGTILTIEQSEITQLQGFGSIAGSSDEIKSITASTGSSALTATISAGNLDFRKAALTDGSVDNISFDDLSITVPSTATLGTTDGVESELIVIALNNSGSVKIAIINKEGGNDLTESGLISTVAITTGADSNNVFYSDAIYSNVPYRVVGSITSTQTTAGTWAQTLTVQGAGGTGIDVPSSVAELGPTTLSGTTSITSLPSGIKRMRLIIREARNGTLGLLSTQLSVSSTFQTTGYMSVCGERDSGSVEKSIASFAIFNNDVIINHDISGIIDYILVDSSSNIWVSSGVMSLYDTVASNYGSQASSGSVTLTGTMDGIRIQVPSGTLYNGTITLLYWL